MTNDLPEPVEKLQVILPRTQATKLPEINQITLPSIKPLEKGKRFNIWPWKFRVQSTLIQFGLEDLIDPNISRPSKDHLHYDRWRSWSTFVRCWLLCQVDRLVVEDLECFRRYRNLELDSDDKFPRYADDLYSLIGEAFRRGEETAKARAAITIRKIRRRDFDSAESYVLKWLGAVRHLSDLKIPLDPYTATKLMLYDLRDDMPVTINQLEDDTDSKRLIDFDRFRAICLDIVDKCKG